MLMQLLIDTINAVPTPRFDVGENVLEAQDLSSSVVRHRSISTTSTVRKKTFNTHITNGNKL